MMRRIHRFVMTVFIVLLCYWAVSGLVLNLYDLFDKGAAFAREGGGAGARAPTVVMGLDLAKLSPLADSDLGPALDAALAVAREKAPDGQVEGIELHRSPAGTEIALRLRGSPLSGMTLNTQSGVVRLSERTASAARPAAAPAELHGSIKRWHRGLIWGIPGATLSFLSGCALLVLWVTGMVLYFDLWGARRRVRRPAFFWR